MLSGFHLFRNYQRADLLTYNTKSSEFYEMILDILSEAVRYAIGLKNINHKMA